MPKSAKVGLEEIQNSKPKPQNRLKIPISNVHSLIRIASASPPDPEMADNVGVGFIRPVGGLDKSSPYKFCFVDHRNPS